MQKMEDICTTKDQVFLNGLLWCDQWSVKAVEVTYLMNA